MSLRASVFVWGLEVKHPTAKFVLLALANHAKDDGTEARPAIATIAAETGLVRRTVQPWLTQLVAWGLIEVQRAAGGHRPTVYRIPIPEDFDISRQARIAPLEGAPDRQSTTQTGNLRTLGRQSTHSRQAIPAP